MSTVHPALYHFVSQPDVSILKPQYIHIHKATVANIHRIQLIAFLMVSSSPELGSSLVRITHISSTPHLPQNLLQSELLSARVMAGIVDNHKTMTHNDIIRLFAIFNNFFVILLLFNDFNFYYSFPVCQPFQAPPSVHLRLPDTSAVTVL
ncbi:hypothetical protein IJL65_03470 [bacterium]|nr:hypothetical protein [bacterium]